MNALSVSLAAILAVILAFAALVWVMEHDSMDDPDPQYSRADRADGLPRNEPTPEQALRVQVAALEAIALDRAAEALQVMDPAWCRHRKLDEHEGARVAALTLAHYGDRIHRLRAGGRP